MQATGWCGDTTRRAMRGKIGQPDADRGVAGFVIPSAHFDVAVTPDQLLRVVNPGGRRIDAFTFDGDPMVQWGEAGPAIDRFFGCCNPASMCLLPDGRFVTAEKGTAASQGVRPSDGNFESVVARSEQLAAHADQGRRNSQRAPTESVRRGGRQPRPRARARSPPAERAGVRREATGKVEGGAGQRLKNGSQLEHPYLLNRPPPAASGCRWRSRWSLAVRVCWAYCSHRVASSAGNTRGNSEAIAAATRPVANANGFPLHPATGRGCRRK